MDDNKARLCRMTLPAINAPDAEIRILRTAPTRGERELRIDYTVTGENGAVRPRFVVCRFTKIPLSQIEPDLESLVTESGPVSGPSLYLMKRYWLRTPEAFEADPGRMSRFPFPPVGRI